MNNSTFIHKYFKSLINSDDITVDMTMGNGNDSFYLSKLSKKVYAFDIQEEALISTKERCRDLNNIIYIKDNHLNFDRYIKEDIKLFVFNLGYLPGSDNEIITESGNTLKTFIKVYEYLKDGYIAITFYRGHKGGNAEFNIIDDYIKKHGIFIQEKYREYKHANEPLSYIIRKHSS
ncbi:MAG: tRNA (mnm(5)s(2)U34)-methyltransferase [Erysipelotrichaceae bacterium]